MMQAKTVDAVERATVYVTYEISKAQQNIKNIENKRILIINKVGTPLFGVEYKRQTIT